ncbi:F-box only protein 9 [Thecamonas trahens ATCC 50062]|uniref:F-box only protein 9 n=1 Tax=Thecamonas trahens ATCC 50062 TaxID=461836 RepID=A0A0L0D8A5_THETB|nr:F-box only protein 9 [Thecamonas trahens ATCC 50062]KNC48475.1 F-box only protein 9 [Thecamonas trahens ATCC 50062]|eukprot:XP_013758587.1 F-box only protein 9 [Thecamonas trahens ATCC 50062]
MESELDQFREEWLAELNESHAVNREILAEETADEARLRQAHELFCRAAALERSGQVTEAMHTYREAFILDPDVDVSNRHAYAQARAAAAEVAMAGRDDGGMPADARPATLADDDGRVESGCDGDAGDGGQDLLAHILSGEAGRVALSHDDADGGDEGCAGSGLRLGDLPLELLLEILKWLDVASLESIARVCRLMFVLSRDNAAWRERLHRVSKPVLARLLPRVGYSWRTALACCPLVRTGGLYICRETYYRRGGQRCRNGTIFEPMYQCVYWRYLQFHANGEFASLCTPEHPSRVVRWLGSSWTIGEDGAEGRGAGGRYAAAKHSKSRPLRTGSFVQRDGRLEATAQDSTGSAGSSTSRTAEFVFRMRLKRFGRPATVSAARTPAQVWTLNAGKIVLESYAAHHPSGKVTPYLNKPQEYHFVSYDELARLEEAPAPEEW